MAVPADLNSLFWIPSCFRQRSFWFFELATTRNKAQARASAKLLTTLLLITSHRYSSWCYALSMKCCMILQRRKNDENEDGRNLSQRWDENPPTSNPNTSKGEKRWMRTLLKSEVRWSLNSHVDADTLRWVVNGKQPTTANNRQSRGQHYRRSDTDTDLLLIIFFNLSEQR